MENNKMRCHFSIIFEKAGGILLFCIFLTLNRLDEIVDVFTSPDFSIAALKNVLLLCLALLVSLTLIMGYQFLVWRKTFIYIDGDTFVIERNTLNRKKSTFSISSIANINLEQNLFERIVGTYRLKLDTDSLSTANSTDVSIVLSAKKAHALKKELLALMKKDLFSNSKENISELKSNDATKAAISYASTKEVLVHCFFSISTALLFITLIVIVGIPLLIRFGEVSLWDIISENNSSFLGRLLAILILVFTYGYSLLKQLFSFYHFCCFRQGNDLIIRYGFLRKQDFTIPLKRINAVQIVQPPLARLTGRMQAKLICIGLGDTDTENPQLTLCMKKKEFYARLQELLPEFSTESLQDVHKLPKGSGIVHLISSLLFLLLFSVGFWTAAFVMKEDVFKETSFFIFYGVTFGLIVLYRLFHYFSIGTYLDKKQLIIHNGVYQRQTWLIPYPKIQIVTYQHNPLTRLFGISKGTINILASLGNSIVSLPFIPKETMQKLGEKLLS